MNNNRDGLPNDPGDVHNPLPIDAAPMESAPADAVVDGYDEEARFELLSAYIDNEVTVEERGIVDRWLQSDPAIQKMYQQLLMLRQAIRTAPPPAPSPLDIPKPPSLWERSSSTPVRWALGCTAAIALLGSFIHVATPHGRQQLKEAWQFIQTLPQKTLFEFASRTQELPVENSHTTFSR